MILFVVIFLCQIVYMVSLLSGKNLLREEGFEPSLWFGHISDLIAIIVLAFSEAETPYKARFRVHACVMITTQVSAIISILMLVGLIGMPS